MGLVPYGENEVGDEGLNSPARGFSLQEAIGTWQFWMFFSMVFCFGFCQMTIMVHIVPHVTGLGISAAIAASVLSVIGGSSILGRIVMGTLADRMGGRPPFIIAFIIMSCALFWLLVAKELWMLYLFALMFGFPYGAMIALQSPMVAELFGLSSHGIILGVAAFGFTVGGSVGPVLAGRIFDIIGSYRAGFLVCAILAVVGFILASLIRPSSREGGGE
jgi:MFS family permease